VALLVGDMERLWGKRYDRRKLHELYGDLGDNALLSTLERGRPHEQVVAAMVLAEHKVATAAPQIARLLAGPYPLARRFAAQALAALRDPPCVVDVDAPQDGILAALAACGLRDIQAGVPSDERPSPPVESGDED
jgi:hypothetical protein